MNSYKFNKNNKYCGTCDYWMSCRTLDSIWTPHNIIIDGNQGYGLCGNRKSGWWNQKKMANQICPVWALWARLRS